MTGGVRPLRADGSLRTAVAAVIIAVLCAVSYANIFSVPFLFDDGFYIKENPLITEPGRLFNASGAGLPWYANFYRHSRFLTFLTLAGNYHFGGWDPAGYHLVNVLVHFANALLLYRLTLLVLRTPRMRDSWDAPTSGVVALAAAAIFASHPLMTNAVTYTTQRSVSLATMWYLLALCSYLSFRLSSRTVVRRASYTLAVGAALAGCVTREIIATLPIAVALAEFLFFLGEPLRRRILPLLPLLPVMVLPAIAHGTTGGNLADSINTATTLSYFTPETTVTHAEYLLTQARVLVTYWRLLLLPVGLVADYDQPVLRSVADVRVLASLALHVGLFATAVACIMGSKSRYRLYAFGILWFYLTNSVESGLLVISETMFEYRAYLAAPVVFMAMSAFAWTGFERLFGTKEKARAAMAIGALGLASLLAGMTIERNRVWQSDLLLWEDVVKKSPGSSRGHYNLALALKDRSRFGEAAQEFEASIALDPLRFEAMNNLGILRAMGGSYQEAIRLYRQALAIKPGYAQARINLGDAYRNLGDYQGARTEFAEALKTMPLNAALRVNLGMVYYQIGRPDLAREEFRAAIRIEPANGMAAGMLRVLQ